MYIILEYKIKLHFIKIKLKYHFIVRSLENMSTML